jgi:hypothetical protein
MIVERYPKSNGVVGGLVLDCEIFSLLDGKTSQVVKCLLWFPKQKSKTKNLRFYIYNPIVFESGPEAPPYKYPP